MCGEKALGAARARLAPGEQRLLQRQPGCLTARSRRDHTRRDSHLQTSLLNHLPSANICQVWEIKWLQKSLVPAFQSARAGSSQAGWQPPRVLSPPPAPSLKPQLPWDRGTTQPPCPACSSARRARTPPRCHAAPLPAWDGCCRHGHHCPCHPDLDISTAPPPSSYLHPHLCTRTAISTRSTSSLQPSTQHQTSLSSNASSPPCQPGVPGYLCPACTTQPSLSLAPGCLCSLCHCP